MERYTFVLRGADDDGIKSVMVPVSCVFQNFTMWRIGPYVFAHFEGEEMDRERMLTEISKLPQSVERVCLPGEMEEMYENRGCVAEEKDGIAHRVFAAKLKPGCAEEYKRRHSTIPLMAKDVKAYESNWGIWLGDGHIFGYCERDPALRCEPTKEMLEETICWEKAQLAIMDWLTDDMDWLTGERHEAVQRIL